MFLKGQLIIFNDYDFPKKFESIDGLTLVNDQNFLIHAINAHYM